MAGLPVFGETAAPDSVDLWKTHAIWTPDECEDIEIFDGQLDAELLKELLQHTHNGTQPHVSGRQERAK
jgi:hypothetical protein